MRSQNSPLLHGCDRCHEIVQGLVLTPDEQVILAKCRDCQQRFYVSATASLPTDATTGEAAAWKFSPDRHLTPCRAKQIQRLIGNHTAETTEHERRSHPRVKTSIPLHVVPLGPCFLPVCQAKKAFSTDISDHGISFALESDREASFWLVEIGKTILPGFQAVMKVVRMRPTEDRHWIVAGPFVTAADMHLVQERLP